MVYVGRQGRRTPQGYKIRHIYRVGNKEFAHHDKIAAEVMAREYEQAQLNDIKQNNVDQQLLRFFGLDF